MGGMTSPLQQIAAKLPARWRSLDTLVAAHRRAGLGWRAIADDLRERTGVSVSHETLRRHFDRFPEPSLPEPRAEAQ